MTDTYSESLAPGENLKSEDLEWNMIMQEDILSLWKMELQHVHFGEKNLEIHVQFFHSTQILGTL